MKNRAGKVNYFIFLAALAGSFVCAILISKGILPEPFWFLTVLLIAFGTMMHNRGNLNAARRETEERRRRRALRKNQSNNRYL